MKVELDRTFPEDLVDDLAKALLPALVEPIPIGSKIIDKEYGWGIIWTSAIHKNTSELKYLIRWANGRTSRAFHDVILDDERNGFLVID